MGGVLGRGPKVYVEKVYVPFPSPRNSGKIPERPRKRSQSVSWNSPREYGRDAPKPCNSRHLRLPEHFQQNSLPPSTAGDASFFRSGSGEGLSESVVEFPAVLRVFLNFH